MSSHNHFVTSHDSVFCQQSGNWSSVETEDFLKQRVETDETNEIESQINSIIVFNQKSQFMLSLSAVHENNCLHISTSTCSTIMIFFCF